MVRSYWDIVGDGGSDIVGQVTAQADRLRSRMTLIRHKVAIMSGKGGVGKSAITANLAATLSDRGHRVGVLDADINGPSMAKMLGVRGQFLPKAESGITPASGPLDIKVVSIDLLLPDDESPVIWKAPSQQDSYVWRGATEASVLREFLADTDWGTLDFLLVDLPPGAHGFPTLLNLLPDLGGTVMVTIPSQVSQLVVRRSISLARDLGAPLIGLVENMAGYCCSNCGDVGPLFNDAPGGDELVTGPGTCHLGRVPFDPRISLSTDWGVPFVLEHGDSAAGKALLEMTGKVLEFLGEAEG